MSSASTADSAAATSAVQKSALRKVTFRLIPFLGLLYFINYLDRTNIGFAGPNGMNDELGLTQAMFGLASGVFFIGYLILEVPSNMALHKFGARVWIARILVTWGIIAALMAFVQGPTSLLIVRLLLGIAEAGFFPGIVLYMTFWFPKAERAKAMALFMSAIPLSTVIGAPLSAWLIEGGHQLLWGMSGWRFMYLIEGIPAVLLGLLCLFYMTDRPKDAKWLEPAEREWLQATMDAEESATAKHNHMSWGKALGSGRVWGFAMVYFGLVYGLYAMSFFLPTIIAGFQERFNVTYTIYEKGLLTAIPFFFATICMLAWGWHGDKTKERVWHVAIPGIVAAVAIPITTFANSPYVAMILVTIFTTAVLSGLAAFWPLPTAYLSGAAAAAGVALVNSIGNSAGFFGPYITGWLNDLTGAPSAGMWTIGVVMLLGAILTIVLGTSVARRQAAAEAAAQARETASQ